MRYWSLDKTYIYALLGKYIELDDAELSQRLSSLCQYERSTELVVEMEAAGLLTTHITELVPWRLEALTKQFCEENNFEDYSEDEIDEIARNLTAAQEGLQFLEPFLILAQEDVRWTHYARQCCLQ